MRTAVTVGGDSACVEKHRTSKFVAVVDILIMSHDRARTILIAQ